VVHVPVLRGANIAPIFIFLKDDRRKTVETAKIAEKPRCRGTKILWKEERPSCHPPVIVPWIPDRKIDWIY